MGQNHMVTHKCTPLQNIVRTPTLSGRKSVDRGCSRAKVAVVEQRAIAVQRRAITEQWRAIAVDQRVVKLERRAATVQL